MTDLIFHIGLSKCASSTLQQSVFRHEDGYLGTAPGIAPELNMARKLQNVAPFAGRQTLNRAGLREWTNQLRSIKGSRYPDTNRLILSNEMLSSASRLSDRPVLKVLTLLRDHFWGDGEVRVVLVLRNQAARLASRYAQGTNCLFRPGQTDFERTVDQHLKLRRHVRLFDYSRWIEGLHSVIGPENLCVLLLEDSRTLEFWQNLKEFCRLERFEPESMITENSSTKNIRRRTAKSWSISEFDPAFRAKVMTDKWLNAAWPANRQPQLRKRLRIHAISRLEQYYRRKATQMSTERRETEFHLSPRVIDAIRSRCGTANDRLAQQLGRDLHPLGY